MKWCVTSFFLLVLYAGVQLHAQSDDVDFKFFADTKAKAEMGDARAENDLGFCYHEGWGVTQDYGEAVKWYLKAANQGNAEAQFNLGTCYDHGQGVAQDYIIAVKWYSKAANLNFESAEYNLGVHYCEGVTQDYVEAIKWYRKAAGQGNALAQCNLGACYSDGHGVTQDYAEAMKWYRKAANKGNDIAQYNIGNYYISGKGIPQDAAEAVKWFHRAAAQGCANAQYNLGVCFSNGNGVPKDYMEAYKWINLALAQGNLMAKQYMEITELKMTPEQIAEAQRLSAEFIPRKETPSSNSENSASSENLTAIGSGFFITDDGYLISNYHVVKDATKIRLVTSTGTVDAKVIQVDAANDLALLKAVGKFSPLPITASRSAHLGGTVATIGFPDPGLQGFSPKLAKGEIASLSGAADDPRYFQISVPVQPGNSGGALVDERGNVIGIVSAKLDASVALAASGALPENVNYAVKSSLLLSFLESVPDVSAKLKAPNTADEKFEDVVKSAQDAAVLVLVY